MPEIKTMTDVELLNKMLDAATCHARRIANENRERLVDGKNIAVGSVDKLSELSLDVLQVKTRLGELNC